MNPALLAAFGLVTLVAAGLYQAWRGRLSVQGASGQLIVEDVAYPTSADLRNPRRLLEREKLANVLMAVTELVVLVVAGIAAAAVVTTDGISTGYTVLTVGAYLVGAYLVGRVVYVRLGFPTPVASDDGGAAPEEISQSLSTRFDDEVGTAFGAIRGAGASARGEDVTLDPVTAALLAGARSGQRRNDLAVWAAETGVASESTVRNRASELAEAGLLAPGEDLRFSSDRLASADPEDVVAVATSLGA